MASTLLWMARRYDEGVVTWLKVAPSLDRRRDDARYADLLRRMRLD